MDMVMFLQVLAFAGELLSNAESLLRDGLHTSEVADGYSKAAAKASHPGFAYARFLLQNACNKWYVCKLQALQVLESLIIKDSDNLDIRDKQAVSLFNFSSCMSPTSRFFSIVKQGSSVKHYQHITGSRLCR